MKILFGATIFFLSNTVCSVHGELRESVEDLVSKVQGDHYKQALAQVDVVENAVIEAYQRRLGEFLPNSLRDYSGGPIEISTFTASRLKAINRRQSASLNSPLVSREYSTAKKKGVLVIQIFESKKSLFCGEETIVPTSGYVNGAGVRAVERWWSKNAICVSSGYANVLLGWKGFSKEDLLDFANEIQIGQLDLFLQRQ